MRTTIAIALVAWLGCKDKETPPAPPSPGSGSAPAPRAPAKTSDELAKQYEACWHAWSDAQWDRYGDCFTRDAIDDSPGVDDILKGRDAILGSVRDERAAIPDMKGQVKLAFLDGHTAIAVLALAGTNTQPIHTGKGDVPASNKKMGVTIALVDELDDQGRIRHESGFFDNRTLYAELGMAPPPPAGLRAIPDVAPAPPHVAIAKHDATETANKDAIAKLADAFTKHDATALAAMLADDVVWSELAQPKDLDKTALLAQTEALWKGFSGSKLTVDKTWAAGDVVVAREALEGTNDGDLPIWSVNKTGRLLSLPMLAVYELAGGKIRRAQVFYESIAINQQLQIPLTPRRAKD